MTAVAIVPAIFAALVVTAVGRMLSFALALERPGVELQRADGSDEAAPSRSCRCGFQYEQRGALFPSATATVLDSRVRLEPRGRTSVEVPFSRFSRSPSSLSARPGDD